MVPGPFEEPFDIRIEPPPAELQLKDYWEILVRHRRSIALSVAACLAIAAVTTLATRPRYRGTVVLHVEQEMPAPLEVGPAASAPRYDPDFLVTQTRLMKSRDVAERAVEALGRVPPAGAKFPAQQRSDAVMRAALRLEGATSATPVRGTTLVELSCVAPSGREAADWANAMARSYIEWTLESRFQFLRQASDFLAGQIHQIKGELDESEQKLLAYGREKNIVSADPQSNGAIPRLDALNREYAAAVADRVAKEARDRELQKVPAGSLIDPESSALVSQLRADQARLEREYAEKLDIFKPAYPAMQQLKTQIDKGRQHLASAVGRGASRTREAAHSDYEAALAREESLKKLLVEQKQEALSGDRDAVAYDNLKIDITTKRSLLDALLKRQAEADILSNLRIQGLSNTRVVDRALPPGHPFRPSYPLNAAAGLLAGAGLGIGLAIARSTLDRSLRTTEQVERYLQLPPLGVIPTTRSLASGWRHAYRVPAIVRRRLPEPREEISIELLPHTDSHSTVAEAYRSFMAALVLSDPALKSFAITSALPKEGKTATAVNLAVVLGQLGRRVLLIDADLHKPRLQEVLHVSNAIGLSTVLSEKMPESLAIVRAGIPGVFVLPAGPESENPSALLASPAMSHVLKQAASEFDQVIIDTPPLFPMADLLVFGALTDGVVLCVKGGRTPREQVARVRDRLRRANMRVLGVVINELREEADAYAAYAGRDGYFRLPPPRPSQARGSPVPGDVDPS